MKATKNYTEINNTVINRQALAAIVPAARRWVKKSGTLEALAVKRSVERKLSEKQLKKYVDNTIMALVKAYTAAEEKAAEEKAAQKAAAAAKKAQEKHDRNINACIDDSRTYDYHGERRTVVYTYCNEINRAIRTGENIGELTAKFADKNGIECREVRDYDGYSKRCQWTMVRRSFCLNIRRGYKCRVIAGILTFYRGQFCRQGMACEWVEQGRAISDIRTIKGYIVRGEHIEAKSLKDAQRINAEHRVAQLSDALKQRQDVHRQTEQNAANIAALAGYRFTFADSLASGNCRPGTQAFKQRVEQAVGHEVETMTLAELREYGKRFGVTCYTDRLINYMATRINK